MEAAGTVLTHSDMRAGNTFAHPEEVKPAQLKTNVVGDAIEVLLPRGSVAVVECKLG
jgi:alpha-L-arabinofuranosidase